MKAVTWQGKRDMRVEEVPDPHIIEDDDIIVEVTSTGLCGSDLHLYEVLTGFMTPGDIVGHEPMGVVAEVGPGVRELNVGDRVVVPFNVSCGTCWMCEHNLHSQCETTQNRDQGTGASLFGYSSLYGAVPGGQAEYLRVPFGNQLPMKVPHGPSDDRFLFLSDVLPTAWQALKYADPAPESTVLVIGAGPIGDMATRFALHAGHRVLTVDRVPERLARVGQRGAEAIDMNDGDVVEQVRELTNGRGADAVIEAVGMEAHGSPIAEGMTKLVSSMPGPASRPMMKKAGLDRMAALYTAFDAVRRGGTISISGVYGGAMDPVPMMQLFDKQVQLRMGQANVRSWTEELMPFLEGDDDPLGVESFATHHLPLSEAPEAYKSFQEKAEGMVKVVFNP
ncbi:threonine dehydrogenase-like Zn-dependent dehydrogenase [Nocardioides luteus]|uniref:Glutathione-dependent formaldehyde dehydrogenase n=1 Tax=Nocardioides luteus TaxID=1844 RepID=A0ABQ5ST60_9ACTN|nr:alcohol dehydrogenase catalytic domain-containing protein [Nocardioides luteus]MDR7311182.1 threonine dehydrogenase-like Zn-dependent dehydrogenase [Nocardioides luteus]GGR62858.1 glutathione-dependent formaldehyde dehydrogenase [Nocardioides luteus]GLJ66728.1 glutathione-dependent formaldehyde dehydrogenase [Nocardioides luteus]